MPQNSLDAKRIRRWTTARRHTGHGPFKLPPGALARQTFGWQPWVAGERGRWHWQRASIERPDVPLGAAMESSLVTRDDVNSWALGRYRALLFAYAGERA